jgi:hypothetical protein
LLRRRRRRVLRLAVGTNGHATSFIEVEIGDMTVRFGRGADAKTVAAVDSRVEGRDMIGPTSAVRVLVATKPVDFRKGAEGA